MSDNKFWNPDTKRFDEVAFVELIEELITHKARGIMADLTRLTAAVNEQSAHIQAIQSKTGSQGARITDLEAQLSAASSGVDQAALDALAATMEANNELLKSIAS